MCGYFYFIKGSYGIITKNIDIANGVANGTSFNMMDIILKPNHKIFQEKIEDIMSYAAAVNAAAVDYILYRHRTKFFKNKKNCFFFKLWFF